MPECHPSGIAATMSLAPARGQEITPGNRHRRSRRLRLLHQSGARGNLTCLRAECGDAGIRWPVVKETARQRRLDRRVDEWRSRTPKLRPFAGRRVTVTGPGRSAAARSCCCCRSVKAAPAREAEALARSSSSRCSYRGRARRGRGSSSECARAGSGRPSTRRPSEGGLAEGMGCFGCHGPAGPSRSGTPERRAGGPGWTAERDDVEPRRARRAGVDLKDGRSIATDAGALIKMPAYETRLRRRRPTTSSPTCSPPRTSVRSRTRRRRGHEAAYRLGCFGCHGAEWARPGETQDRSRDTSRRGTATTSPIWSATTVSSPSGCETRERSLPREPGREELLQTRRSRCRLRRSRHGRRASRARRLTWPGCVPTPRDPLKPAPRLVPGPRARRRGVRGRGVIIQDESTPSTRRSVRASWRRLPRSGALKAATASRAAGDELTAGHTYASTVGVDAVELRASSASHRKRGGFLPLYEDRGRPRISGDRMPFGGMLTAMEIERCARGSTRAL